MDVTFKLAPQDLVNYRYAVRDRLARTPTSGFLGKEWVRAAIFCVGGVGLYLLLDSVVPRLTDASLSLVELGFGFLVGLALCIAVLWLNYSDQAKKLMRPDGPTLSVRTISVNTSGLNVSAPHMTAHYAWPAIQEVSATRGLVILWLEPSMGLAIPVGAFADAPACDAFVAAIEARRKESDLPRAGSFSAS